MILAEDEIGIWKTYGPVKIHKKDCNFTRVINISRGNVPVVTQVELDDLIGRGFGVVKCRCTK